MKSASFLASAVFLLASGRALAVDNSHAVFRPATPGDAKVIYDQGKWIQNSDTVNYRGVVAAIGVGFAPGTPGISLWTSATNVNEGLICYYEAVDLADGSSHYNFTNAGQDVGFHSYAIAPPTDLKSGHNYSWSLLCYFAPVTDSFANATKIIGAVF